MFQYIIILSSVLLSSCQYKELSKHGSVNVAPKTKVYLDISSFPVGELISFEIDMDLFFGDYLCKERYEFYIEQVPATTYYDAFYWNLNNLRKVVNKNVTCSGGDCTFSLEEIKEEDKNFIYIYPPAPFVDFYTMWGNKIKIKHLGGTELSAGAIIGIVIGCLVVIAAVIALVSCCCCCAKGSRYYNCCPGCACCCCRRTYAVNVPAPVATVQVQVQQPVYPVPTPVVNYADAVPPPAYPTPVYPPPTYQPEIGAVPYSSSNFV